MKAHRPTIYNLTLTTANTEYSQELPKRTVKIQVQSRNDNDMKISFVSGESGSKYFTIKGGQVYFDSEIFRPDGSYTLYVQSDVANEVAEILAWTHD